MLKKLHKRTFKFLPNDYVSSYGQLLQKTNKASINLGNHRDLSTKIFKTVIDLNPNYMIEIFERSLSNKRPEDRIVRWISVHSKQIKLDMELRAWGALHQKFRIHCL